MNNFCMSDTVLGTGDMVAYKTDHGTALMKLSCMETNSK